MLGFTDQDKVIMNVGKLNELLYMDDISLKDNTIKQWKVGFKLQKSGKKWKILDIL